MVGPSTIAGMDRGRKMLSPLLALVFLTFIGEIISTDPIEELAKNTNATGGLMNEFTANYIRKYGYGEWVNGDFPTEPQPFIPVWNALTQNCGKRYGIHINMSKWGILDNPKDGWRGPFVSLLADYGVTGLLGRAPQFTNISLLTETIAKNVPKYLKDEDFNGLAVVDWEMWRPIWENNFDAMSFLQKQSIEAVERRHPDWPKSLVNKIAKIEFEEGARAHMMAMLKVGKALRPKAKFGFFHIPNTYRTKLNDGLRWLWESSPAMYPSIYFYSESQSIPSKRAFVRKTVREAVRLKKAYGSSRTLVFPYSLPRYHTYGHFYSEAELDASITESALAGADGIVFWGDQYNEANKEACNHTANYIETVFGPFIKNLLNFTNSCSQKECNGHGRCTVPTDAKARRGGKVLYINRIRSLLGLKPKPDPRSQDSVYKMKRKLGGFDCLCFPGWTGEKCSKKARTFYI